MAKKNVEKKPRGPLKKTDVTVDAQPKKGAAPNAGPYSRRVDEQTKKKIEDALKRRPHKGADKQLNDAQKAVDEAAAAVDPNLIGNVKVRIKGEADDEVVDEKMDFVPGRKRDTSDDEPDDDDDDGNDADP